MFSLARSTNEGQFEKERNHGQAKKGAATARLSLELVKSLERRAARSKEHSVKFHCADELFTYRAPVVKYTLNTNAQTMLMREFSRMVEEAARLLHRIMDGKPPPKQPILVPAVGLVVRESTDFYSVDDPQVAAALKFIAANSHRPIGPNEVAKAVNAETRTLKNRFGKLLKRPIATEIRRVRLERAKRELTQSSKRLAQIARDVGIGELMRMYEVFRRELGISPGRFRKQRRIRDEA